MALHDWVENTAIEASRVQGRSTPSKLEMCLKVEMTRTNRNEASFKRDLPEACHCVIDSERQ